MIVKNEAAIIGRLLKSCLPVIDCICILDTGSTDDTKAVIETFAVEHGLPCTLRTEPFVNFAVSRTRALELAKGLADYILLLDADMVLDPGDVEKNFTAPGYLVEQGNDAFQYSNVRLVRDDVAQCYSGVTHEHLVTKVPIIDKIGWKIVDVGDGGCKADKFSRDERLLRHGLVDEPKNDRYHFYLANTYFDVGKNELAKEFYEKRVALGGWDEEVYYSMYRLALSCKRLGLEDEFLANALKAWAFRPQRVEALYELMLFFAQKKQYSIAKKFYLSIKSTQPSGDVLFVHRSCLVDADYQYSLMAYYMKDTAGVYAVYANLFNTPKFNLYAQFNNYKFYKPVLKPLLVKDLAPLCEIGELHASTPCVSTIGDHYLVNVRLVNYVVEGARYIYDGCVRTENHMLELRRDFSLMGGKRLPQPPQLCAQYHGIEDVRFTTDGKFSGVTARVNGSIGVSVGSYPSMEHKELKNKTPCEKNWVYLPGSAQMVYQWHPLKLGCVEGEELVLNEEKPMPRLFEMARGSTNGTLFDNEVWFVVHFVHQFDAEPRFYYHALVVFDTQMNLKRYTLPFKFSETPVEYCLGIVVEPDRLLISHSANDASSLISAYAHDEFKNLWVNA